MRSRLTRLQSSSEPAESITDLNLLPILSLMMILIPLLVGKTAFFDLVSLEVDIPNIRPASEVPDSKRAVLLRLSVNPADQMAEIIDEESGIVLSAMNYPTSEHGQQLLRNSVLGFQERYPKLDTAVVVVDPAAPYNRLVRSLQSFSAPSVEAPRLKVVVIPNRGL